MIGNDIHCPDCGKEMSHYDSVRRLVKGKDGTRYEIKLKRYRCKNCGKIHRQIPDKILPYKQYEAEIIQGVVEGSITPFLLDFEDYPCEMTMKRWREKYIPYNGKTIFKKESITTKNWFERFLSFIEVHAEIVEKTKDGTTVTTYLKGLKREVHDKIMHLNKYLIDMPDVDTIVIPSPMGCRVVISNLDKLFVEKALKEFREAN